MVYIVVFIVNPLVFWHSYTLWPKSQQDIITQSFHDDNNNNGSQSNLDRSRFVRRDQSSPAKQNVSIFLVVVGVVILFSSVQSTADQLN